MEWCVSVYSNRLCRLTQKVIAMRTWFSTDLISYLLGLLCGCLALVVGQLFLEHANGSQPEYWLRILGFHFGVGSWLFLFAPKTGRLVAVFTALSLLIWPLSTLGSALANPHWLLMTVGYSLFLTVFWNCYLHISDYGDNIRFPLAVKILMILPPVSLVVFYAIVAIILADAWAKCQGED